MTTQEAEQSTPARSWPRKIGLFAGPLMAILVLFLLPESYQMNNQTHVFSWEGRETLAIMVWMSIWWLTEAVHVTITSLLPLATFPLLKIATIKDTAAPYADKLIFLYMGGFFLALAMQHWGLGKRIALLTIRMVGTKPYWIVAGFMITTAIFSAFVSNTATAVMMVAIAGNLTELASSDDKNSKRFGTCLMLAIAYSASIGGISTIIGTPPNTILVGFLKDSIDPAYQIEISFRQWLLYGVPISLIMLPIAYFVLLWMFPVGSRPLAGGQTLIDLELRKLGRMKRPEWIVLAVFCFTVALWMAGKSISQWKTTWGNELVQPFAFVTDEAIVMATSFLLFVLPAGTRAAEHLSSTETQNQFVLEWPVARKLPWGILLLFGGGLTLAAAVKQHQVAEFLASMTSSFNGVPSWILILAVTTAVVFLTELTSNAATTASLVPILAAIAPTMGIHPFLLVFPAAFAASCAFMLPVATPPNAIVFGTGHIEGRDMARAGFVLNLFSILIISLVTWFWLKPVMGL